MRREEMEQVLVGYLYGELTPEERITVERELRLDPAWVEVLEELRSTVGILRRWEDEDPAVRTVLTTPGTPDREVRRDRPPRVRRRWGPIVPAAVGVAAALILVVANTEVGVEDGRFRLSFGKARIERVETAIPASVPLELGTTVSSPGAGPYVTEEDFLRSQAELVRFVATLLRDSEERQSDRFLNAFAEYARELEEKREGDFVVMERRLNVVEDGARDILDRVKSDIPPSPDPEGGVSR
ncbi:MAG: hypothetical protein ABIK65_04030 [Candidatus Eisenbacteria bacterium]